MKSRIILDKNDRPFRGTVSFYDRLRQEFAVVWQPNATISIWCGSMEKKENLVRLKQ